MFYLHAHKIVHVAVRGKAMFKREPLFLVNVATGQNSLTEKRVSGPVFDRLRVSTSKNGNLIRLKMFSFNVIATTRFLYCVFQPKIQKGKAPEKVIHPYSRKAASLAREESRLKRKER